MRNKRPLVGVALLFSVGIGLGSVTAIPSLIGGALLGVFLLAFVFSYRSRTSAWFFFPCPLLLGMFLCRAAIEVHSPRDLRSLLGDAPQHVALRGVVIDWPQTRWTETPRGEFGRTSMRVRVDAINRADAWQGARGTILVHFMEFDERATVAYGDQIEFAGAIERPPEARNPGQFDYRGFLARQGIHYQCRLAGPSDLHVIDSGHGNWLMHVAATANEHFKRLLARGIEEEEKTVGLLWAIVLGFRPGLTNELAEPFMRTGTLHVFAVSGFHIGLVGAILVASLRLLRFSRKTAGLSSIPLLLIYTLITGAPPSAERAFIMSSVVIFAYSLQRPSDIFNSLAAAALIVLAINPLQLFDAGFQLSFFVVLAIALFTPRVHDHLLRWAKPDPFLPWDVVPKWRRWIFRPLNKTLLFAAVSFAAVIGSAPLIATYFNLMTPVAFLSNVLIVPLSAASISLGFLSIVTGDLVPWAAGCFNNTNYLLLNSNVWLTQQLTRLPFAYFYVRTPPWFLVAMYYAVAAAMLSGWAWQNNIRKLVTLAATAIFVTTLGVAYFAPHSTTLTVLDVGGGQAMFLDQRGSRDLLIDAGRPTHGDRVVRPFLRSRGINRLETILLTVNGINHAGGLAAILDHFRFERLFESGFPSQSRSYRHLAFLPTLEGRRQTLAAGAEMELSPRIRLKVLHPPEQGEYRTAEDNSIVCLLECDGVRVLSKSSIGESVERDLVEKEADLTAQILITGQHPHETNCTDAFLDRVQPQVVILNAGSFPTYAHPREDMLERIQRRGIQLFRTDQHYAVEVIVRHGDYRIRPFRDATKSREN